MTKDAESTAFAADKQRLIREGELYRIKVVHSKALVANAMHPDALFHGAVDHAVGLAQARLGGLLQPGGMSGFNYKALMPYALTVGSFIARKKLIKPALGVAAVLGLGAAWLMRRKRVTG
ncbi:hypothetical protein SAMN05428959_10458 [Duganella sp. CF517]|uniref:hypothetical protein n=1 Tax=Duganella sp. CF517 TaxID=1881038 RepID=UPI0008B40F60|nr:hypothetical protein [Duganella sp. CF517]SEN99167.1 hypothetical protein SAMN05428959_10458 [Duganella sp. CF517]